MSDGMVKEDCLEEVTGRLRVISKCRSPGKARGVCLVSELAEDWWLRPCKEAPKDWMTHWSPHPCSARTSSSLRRVVTGWRSRKFRYREVQEGGASFTSCLEVCSQALPVTLASGLANSKPSMEKQVRWKLSAQVVTIRKQQGRRLTSKISLQTPSLCPADLRELP